MRSFRRRRLLIVPLALAVVVGAAAWAAGSEPGSPLAPLASRLAVGGGLVTMEAAFHNHGAAGLLAATDHNHTSPADFQLTGADGVQRPEVFGAGCPNWGRLDVRYGASGGPERLCFRAPPGGLRGAEMAWAPDLGLLFDHVTVKLQSP